MRTRLELLAARIQSSPASAAPQLSEMELARVQSSGDKIDQSGTLALTITGVESKVSGKYPGAGPTLA